MSISKNILKTLSTILATALIGSLTIFLGLPKKVSQSKSKIVKSRSTMKGDAEENLFI